MKTLKRITEGKIVYETFNGTEISVPLKDRANYTKGTGYIDLHTGTISLDAFAFPNMVLEVKNSFIPAKELDFGGIQIKRNNEVRELYEYLKGSDLAEVMYVKVHKIGDVYNGYGSENGLVWEDMGYINFPEAETVGISVKGSSDYRINHIKAYTYETITVYGLLNGWTIKVKDANGILVVAETSVNEAVTFELAGYPFTGTVEIYDATTQVAQFSSSDFWGGDEYVCTVDVELYTNGDQPLNIEVNRHLGKLTNYLIEEKFKIKNLSDAQSQVTVQVAVYSPFGSWVEISLDNNDVPVEYLKSLDFTLDPLGGSIFWLRIVRPSNFTMTDEMRVKECEFYLEII